MATVAIIGTCDTKLEELLFLQDRIRDCTNTNTILIDVGWRHVKHDAIEISQKDLLLKYVPEWNDTSNSRGVFVNTIAQCAAQAVQELFRSGKIHGVVSAGGSGGTSIASVAMKSSLPIGFPKLIVSTIASGDTAPIVGETDIMLMSSVVDISGLNHVLQDVLSNAGAAIAACAKSYLHRMDLATKQPGPKDKKRVGITMFGVTTPGVDAIRLYLESQHPIETYVFHATGNGGRAMERLIRDSKLDAVIDLTTTEICDFVMGGVMSAGEERLDAATEAGIPVIISLGATDMANFGAKHTVPERYKDRKLVEHNPIVTLVRSSPSDCREIGNFICRKLKKARKPDMIEMWIPKGGLSVLSVCGAPFEDAAADVALFDALTHGLKGSGIKIVEDERDINHRDFAIAIAKALVAKMDLAA